LLVEQEKASLEKEDKKEIVVTVGRDDLIQIAWELKLSFLLLGISSSDIQRVN
jgi:hypothetical protein